MAIIQSGASSDQLTIDPTSKAARVTLYDSAGNEPNKAVTGAYLIALNMGRLSAAVAAGSYIWGMRNGASATRTIYIRRIRVIAGFDGTAAASTSLLDIVRYSGADLAGGTAISLPAGAVKKRSSYGDSVLGDARYNAAAALTTTGVTFGTAFASFGVPRGATGGNQFFEAAFHSPNESYDCFELAAGEGIAFKLNVVAVVGDSFSGFIEWDEL